MTDFHDRITPTHVDKPLINKPEEKFCFAAPAVGIVMRVLLDRHKQSLVLEVVQYPIDGRGIKRRSACELAEAFKEYTGLVEGRDWNETFLLPEREILLAASWGDMYDTGTFSFAHSIPRNHPMNLACG